MMSASTVKCSVYIATSVDGFIARPDGSIDWLQRPEYATTELQGLRYEDFIATVDTLVMGRKTFEQVLTFEQWPYEGVPVVVLSHRSLAIPEQLAGKVRLMNGVPAEIVAQLGVEGKQHLYIDGGKTIQRFLEAGLIDELTITRVPIVLGAGIGLFGDPAPEQRLELLECSVSANGFVQVRYARVRPHKS
ncbi:dihydrofolate reductase [Candidatus Chloroploca sp. M-50]|uniref:Dihydrofolate reductase n=1 Tax=Candidatus Chloroploca mongolica TaxID=2528176 RepID=A0ABS4DB26_9CHLR|nr:dihydrofolate reductase family protein [Candidatus Chloroploca mongolica]MBP1466640.1 dihydrofolate reductase [Candidatus Chloroploca mongolica]